MVKRLISSVNHYVHFNRMYFNFQSRLCNIGCRSNFLLPCVTFFLWFQKLFFLYIKYTYCKNDSERVYFLSVLTLLFRRHTDNWKKFKCSSLIPCVNIRFWRLILSHMCVPLCFLNFSIHETICLHLVHIMLPLVYSRVNIWITKLRIGGIDFQELCSFITYFWYFCFYERVYNMCLSVI